MHMHKSITRPCAHRQHQMVVTTALAANRKKRNQPDTPVRPGDPDDPLLQSIAKEMSPVEAVKLVQWYPGHIARAERNLKDQLSAVDLVLEVRDGRIPLATSHPKVPEWVGHRPTLLLLNRKDMVSGAERQAWSQYFSQNKRQTILWTDGNGGEGVAAVIKLASQTGLKLNEKRLARGLRPRAVRAVVIGFPNVGKSALINRLLGRRVADSAPRPGVTRTLKWSRVGGELDLLDAPGIIPAALSDQTAAAKLAMCNDIGEAAYVASLVAAAFLDMAINRPYDGDKIQRAVEGRYKLSMDNMSSEEYVHAVGERWFNGEPERAGQRILKDYRTLVLGRFGLEMPPRYQ